MIGTATTLFQIAQTNSTDIPPPVDFGPSPGTGSGEFNPAALVVLGFCIFLIIIFFGYKKVKGKYDPEERVHQHAQFVKKARGFNLGGYFMFTIFTGMLFIVDIFYFTLTFRDVPIFAIIGMIGVGSTIGWARKEIRDWYRKRQRGITIRGPLRTPEGAKDGVIFRNVEFKDEYTLSQRQRKKLEELNVPAGLIDSIRSYPSIINREQMALWVFGCEKEKAMKTVPEADIDPFGTVLKPTAHLDMLTQGTIEITVANKRRKGEVMTKEVPVIRVLYDDFRAQRDIEGMETDAVDEEGTNLGKWRAEHNESRVTAGVANSYRQAFIEEAQRGEDTALITDAIGMAKAAKRFRNQRDLTRFEKLKGAMNLPTAVALLCIGFGLAIGLFIGIAYANNYWLDYIRSMYGVMGP